MSDYDDDEEEIKEFFDILLLSGALEIDSVDENGEPHYIFTEKCKELFPDLYAYHIGHIDDLTFSLWQLDVLDLKITEDTTYVSFRKKNYENYLLVKDDLTEEQLHFLDFLMDKNMRDIAEKYLNDD